MMLFKMNNKELFYKYTDFTNLQGIGAGWVAQIKGYMPVGDWITKASMYWIALGAVNIKWVPFWVVILFLATKFYTMIFINWWIGRKAIKIKLYEAQQQYNAKTEHLNPYQVELRKTVENIAEAVKAKSEFTKL